MDLNQVLYTVFRAEFESGSKIGPKPPQNPIFLIISIFMFFYMYYIKKFFFIGFAQNAKKSKSTVRNLTRSNFLLFNKIKIWGSPGVPRNAVRAGAVADYYYRYNILYNIIASYFYHFINNNKIIFVR